MPVSPPPKRASYDETSSVSTTIVTSASSAKGSRRERSPTIHAPPSSSGRRRDADADLVEMRARLLERLPRQRPAIGRDRIAAEHARAGDRRDDDGGRATRLRAPGGRAARTSSAVTTNTSPSATNCVRARIAAASAPSATRSRRGDGLATARSSASIVQRKTGYATDSVIRNAGQHVPGQRDATTATKSDQRRESEASRASR